MNAVTRTELFLQCRWYWWACAHHNHLALWQIAKLSYNPRCSKYAKAKTPWGLYPNELGKMFQVVFCTENSVLVFSLFWSLSLSRVQSSLYKWRLSPFRQNFYAYTLFSSLHMLITNSLSWYNGVLILLQSSKYDGTPAIKFVLNAAVWSTSLSWHEIGCQ